MTRSDALRALLAKVEAGTAWDAGSGGCFVTLAYLGTVGQFSAVDLAIKAFKGSLDAAKALHEAVLPGWDWGRSAASGQFYVWNTGKGPASALSNNKDPARAWLIAILKALIATEDN